MERATSPYSANAAYVSTYARRQILRQYLIGSVHVGLLWVILKGRDRAGRKEASGRAQGAVWGGTKPDPEEGPIFGPCQLFLAASNSRILEAGASAVVAATRSIAHAITSPGSAT